MANPSHNQIHVSSSFNNGNCVPELSVAATVLVLTHNSCISLEEQAVLDEGLITYASESHLTRCSNIAPLLQSQTARDVALRNRWMDKICTDYDYTLNYNSGYGSGLYGSYAGVEGLYVRYMYTNNMYGGGIYNGGFGGPMVVMTWVVVLMDLKIPIIHTVLHHPRQDVGFHLYVW